MTVDPELVDRFRTDLRALWGDDEGARLGIAFSGGPDSLALLLLAQTAMPDRVAAASVDHGLRPESADEVRHAADICRSLGVPHAILEVEVAEGNLQAEARLARYAALARWAQAEGVAAICTAHHADDQAETFLMRANRGSGLAGLSGVRGRNVVPETDIAVLRPLLRWRRSALEEIAANSDFEPVRDPSNEDPSFDRVRMREALATSDFIDVEAVSRSARMLAEMQDAVAGLASDEWARAKQEDGAPARYRPLARMSIYRPAFLAEVMTHMGSDFGIALSRSDAARIVADLIDGRPVNIAGIQARASTENDKPVWTFAPEKPRRTA
ncbi:tRNA lysidine(34) synthetase TilS [Qipengyuania sp. 1NDW9]|uniref:tRNA lysidine(34) synthetase TilS n=1 Tax=Qipengyuania xiapuensis TaxID=2867236 RepID=UPI001C86BBD5|nr:tRNA lysidine(34) synthetase TilS [Qipengyuania xiapuensis]MBX7493827.1 tRNA lysidine(34) synthetase TilS [Qipengyuania xiapuensis]